MVRRVSGPWRLAAVASPLCLLTLTSGCGSSPTQPTPPPSLPSITCPADVSAQSVSGAAVPVTYSAPTTTGGSAPVAVACTPTSGANFSPGKTPVICTATDALSRSATCSFSVSVVVPPQLRLTNFLAFGDSMTEGTVSDPATLRLLLATPESYPSQLQEMLQERYTAQTLTMINEGKAGYQARRDVERLTGLLQSARPEVLLLMEGANDLNNGGIAVIPAVVDAMEEMVERARAAGTVVFLATLPPQREGGPKAKAPASIVPYNRELAKVAGKEGAVLVDVYTAIGSAVPGTLIGADGLHPTADGYVRIAETFLAAIRTSPLEIPGTADAATAPPLGVVVPTATSGTAPEPAGRLRPRSAGRNTR